MAFKQTKKKKGVLNCTDCTRLNKASQNLKWQVNFDSVIFHKRDTVPKNKDLLYRNEVTSDAR